MVYYTYSHNFIRNLQVLTRQAGNSMMPQVHAQRGGGGGGEGRGWEAEMWM
jgi:hypothetical protein